MKAKMKVSMEVVDGMVQPKSDNVFPKTNKEALEHSIQKYQWLKLWAAKQKGLQLPDLNSGSCALCDINRDRTGSCIQCPVYLMTREQECRSTPFWLLAKYTGRPITQATLDTIDCETLFLKSLRRP